ncbi:MAG: transglycosylase SLT domain-containing protein [Roseomonas sp.]|nr:transglycosylase SLT domain-containing protein [Roseomonas sp.]
MILAQPFLERALRRVALTLGALLGLALSPSGAAAQAVSARGFSEGHLCRAAIAEAERGANLPRGLLQAIGRVESGRRDPETGQFAPWPWTINAEGEGKYFPTREAAIAHVRQLQARGVRIIDVGCMQVNLHHHPNAFTSLEQAFDPLTNARYAARFLTELNGGRSDWRQAAGHYHSQTPERAGPYREKVLAAWEQEARNAGDSSAEALALARLRGGWGSVALASAGGISLSNRAERARVIPLEGGGGALGGAAGGASPGRGLDAYRSAPIHAVSRPMVLAQAGPGRTLR